MVSLPVLMLKSNVTKYAIETVTVVFSGLLLTTALRVAIMPALPIFMVIWFWCFRLKLSWWFVGFLLVSGISTIIASHITERFYFSNLLLSYTFILPMVALLFSNPDDNYTERRTELLKTLIKTVTSVMVINNILGYFQYITNPHDDAFIGLYGRHHTGMHGLALLNGLLFLYYFGKAKNLKTSKADLGFAFFFGLSFVMAFYGMGLLILVSTVVLYFLLVKKQFSFLFALPFVAGILGLVMWIVAPDTLRYNLNNIKLGVEALTSKNVEKTNTPRKIWMFFRFGNQIQKDAAMAVWGTGPGTYNSRASFLLNGDYASSNPLERILGVSTPELASKQAYPLWDTKILSGQYQDGTRNMPFSSLLSIWAEYGFFCLTLLLVGIFFYFKEVKYSSSVSMLLGTYFVLNIILDNFLELNEGVFTLLLAKLLMLNEVKDSTTP